MSIARLGYFSNSFSKSFFFYLNKYGNEILKLNKNYIQKAIYKSCLIKKQIVQLDENEKNIRKILNFGHTFAHAYESTKKFSKNLNHGEAVLLGINSAIKFSVQNKILSKNEFNIIKNHFIKFKLPYNLKKIFSKKDVNKILLNMRKDKKNKDKKINLVLLKKIGKQNYKLYISKKNIFEFFQKELNN